MWSGGWVDDLAILRGVIPVDEAVRVVVDAVGPLPAEEVPLTEAHGLVLADDVTARDDVPFAAVSAMDGFAVVAADTRGATPDTPRRLRLAGPLVAAGIASPGRVGAGEAAPVATGGLVPPGADAVVRKEDAAVDGGTVIIRAEAEEGENVRPAGDDMRAGEVVLARGTALGGLAAAVAAAAGRAVVRVHRRPRLAILATGDELVPPGADVGPGRTRASSSVGLAGLARASGAEPIDLGIARDAEDEIREKVEWGLASADALVTTGGVSVGERDLVRPVLESLGFAAKFHGVAVKPGKPLLFGLAGARPVFGLPGNPVSTLVAFEIFVRPALRRLGGHARLFRPTVKARLEGPIRRSPGREEYLRAEARRDGDRWSVRVVEGQGSHQVKGLGATNALVVVPPETVAIPAGDEVDAVLLTGDDVEVWRT